MRRGRGLRRWSNVQERRVRVHRRRVHVRRNLVPERVLPRKRVRHAVGVCDVWKGWRCVHGLQRDHGRRVQRYRRVPMRRERGLQSGAALRGRQVRVRFGDVCRLLRRRRVRDADVDAKVRRGWQGVHDVRGQRHRRLHGRGCMRVRNGCALRRGAAMRGGKMRVQCNVVPRGLLLGDDVHDGVAHRVRRRGRCVHGVLGGHGECVRRRREVPVRRGGFLLRDDAQLLRSVREPSTGRRELRHVRPRLCERVLVRRRVLLLLHGDRLPLRSVREPLHADELRHMWNRLHGSRPVQAGRRDLRLLLTSRTR